MEISPLCPHTQNSATGRLHHQRGKNVAGRGDVAAKIGDGVVGAWKRAALNNDGANFFGTRTRGITATVNPQT